MKIQTLLGKKDNGRGGSGGTRTAGAVRVVGGTVESLDGTIINPAVVNANELNVNQINSNNISNTNTITTAYLNADALTAGMGNFTTLSSLQLQTQTIEVTGDATFHNDITVSGTSNLNNVISNTLLNKGLLTTQDLEVTGSAHFFELVIDKIKAAGGSLLITPADGFTIDDVTYGDVNLNGHTYTNCPYLWFRAEDGGRTIKNMWQTYDQAICANFNEVDSAGTYHDVSNNFWWYMVGATDNDNNARNIDVITSYSYGVEYGPSEEWSYNYSYYTYTYTYTYTYAGARLHPIYTSSGEYIDTVPCHYIALIGSKHHISSIDLSNEANLKKQIGNDVAMLGHNADDPEYSYNKNRTSAVYISCYTNWLDSELVPPLWAHYKDINSFSLVGKRLTKFDANGGDIVGSFKVQAGGTTQSLYDYIMQVAGQTETDVYVTADYQSNQLETIVMQADENNIIYNLNNFPNSIQLGIRHNGNMVTNISDYNSLTLEVFGETIDLLNFTPYSSSNRPTGIYVSSVTSIATTMRYFVVNFAFNGSSQTISNTSININGNVDVGSDSYNANYSISVPVVSIEGTDAEVLQLGVDTEYAIVDQDTDLHWNFKYNLRKTVGTTTNYISPTSSQKLRLYTTYYDGHNASQQLDWNNGSPGYWGTSGTLSNWYGKRNNEKPLRYKAELLDNSTVVDSRVIDIINQPTSLFDVQEKLTRSIQAESSTSYSYYTSLVQTTNNITTTVSATNTRIDNFETYSYTQFSQIDQREVSITSTVSATNTRLDNLYSYTYTQFTKINQRADSITLSVNTINNGLQSTGINISQHTIDLKADKVTFSNSSGTVHDKISINPTTGTLNATNANISGVLTANVNYTPFIRLTNADCEWYSAATIYRINLDDYITGANNKPLACKFDFFNSDTNNYNGFDAQIVATLPTVTNRAGLELMFTSFIPTRIAHGFSRLNHPSDATFVWPNPTTGVQQSANYIWIVPNNVITMIAISNAWFITNGAFWTQDPHNYSNPTLIRL